MCLVESAISLCRGCSLLSGNHYSLVYIPGDVIWFSEMWLHWKVLFDGWFPQCAVDIPGNNVADGDW